MNKIFTFKVEIEGLENKIWRKIEINSDETLADLSYLILATFELYSSEFFTINYGDSKYDSVSIIFNNDTYKSAMGIKLKDLSFKNNNEMKLEYNYKNKIVFIIKFIDSRVIKEKLEDYHKIVDGTGKGALDFVSGEELKQIVADTDATGESNYFTTIIVDDKEEEEVFDYREFELDDNNSLSGLNFRFIKDEYESITLDIIIRIIKDRSTLYYKSDIKSIVNPFDYKKKYIPDNYNELSPEEINKLNIPEYEDLNIYRLPEYNELNHKDIMTLYVKNNIEEKEIRQALFYALRNHDYMDKFYNNLRKYGLFKDYLDYSHYYYEQIINEWTIKNNIKEK